MAFPLENFYPALICVAVLVVTLVVMALLSFVGTRETTYEEAIAEQKRKEKETVLQPKTEKLPKEKKKKHSKKVKDKPEKAAAECDYDSSETPSSSVTPPVEIIPPKFDNAVKIMNSEPSTKKVVAKAKAGKEQNATKDVKQQSSFENKAEDKNKVIQHEKNKPSEEVKVVEKKSLKAQKPGNQKDAENGLVSKSAPKRSESETEAFPKPVKSASKQDVTDRGKGNAPAVVNGSSQVKQESVSNVGSDVKAKATSKTNNAKTATVKKEESLQSAPISSPSKKSKRKELGSGDSMVIGPRLISALKDAVLTSDEIQTLIEILLNRQQEGESWVKPGQKIDPLCQVKKQLQEKEQQLSEEKQLYEVTVVRLKETKLETVRFKEQFRLIGEKNSALHQELQNLQMHLQRSQEQHDVQINSLKLEFQQVQAKLEKEHHLALQSMEEENSNLKHAVARMEAENSDRARLQHESEQWRDTTDQLQAQVSSLQQTNGELQQHICQLQQQLHEANEETSRHENSHQAHADELLVQLNQLMSEKESLQISIQSLQADNSSLHNKLVNIEKNSTNYNQTIKDLEARLKEKEDSRTKCVMEMESRQHEASHLAQKFKEENQSYQMKNEKLHDDLNKKDMLLTQLQEEVNNKSNTLQKLKEDFETQRKKNNDLRERNWKAMEALAMTEKRADEKLKEADKRVTEAVSEEIKKEQEIRENMEKLFPNLQIPANLNFDEWLQRFNSELGQLGSKDDTQSEDLLKQLDQAKETETSLTAQVQQYQGILTDTEGMLHQLQKSVETEEEMWKKRLNEKDVEMQQLKDEIRLLKEQNTSLEGNLEQIKAAQEAAAEMQEKLKELESKLRVEEKEKHLLEQRIKEAEISSVERSQKLAESTAALAALKKENNNLICQKQDFESDLEKERKTNKDLGSQIVKLNSLVRIGQDSLKAEQEVVKNLQHQLSEQKTSATNGSVELEHAADPNSRNSNENDMLNIADSPTSSLLRFKRNKRGTNAKK